MQPVTITFPDDTTKTFEHAVTGMELLPYLKPDKGFTVALRVNNELFSLTRVIDVRSRVEAVTNQTTEGSNVYRRTLCFVLAAAARRLYPNLRLLVGHSLGYGYYYTLEASGNKQSIDLAALESKMREIITADLPITNRYVSYEEALELFKDSNQPETYRLLTQISRPRIMINTLDEYSDVYFQPLLNGTGRLGVFDLMQYGEGFLLRFPPTAHPDRLSDFEDVPQLFAVYHEYKKWGQMIGVSSVAQLNELVAQRKARDFVEITETLQNKKIAEIADRISARGSVKVVLIAGPSSSGKTTTSKKLSMQLRVLGYEPLLISLDDYYQGRDKTPVDENGQPDFECLEALDVELLNQILVALFRGEEVDLPSFDFKTQTRRFSGKKFRMKERTILILEGIHGLNDRLTPLVPTEFKYKIYLSALTQLNLDDHNRIPTSDNRLLRRIVRDAQFRGKGAAGTISMWASVQRGERNHIFPFQGKADVMFNTALDYELSVLKVYAEPLLRAVHPTEPEYSEASRLLVFLNDFSPIPSSYVPGQSIIREFIGDSDFKY